MAADVVPRRQGRQGGRVRDPRPVRRGIRTCRMAPVQRISLGFGASRVFARALIAMVVPGLLGAVAVATLDRRLGWLGGEVAPLLYSPGSATTLMLCVPGAVVALGLVLGMRWLRQ